MRFGNNLGLGLVAFAKKKGTEYDVTPSDTLSVTDGMFMDLPISDLSPIAWWRADNLHLTSGAVDTEYDKSGNANDATQATGANRPATTSSNAAFNHNPTVDFTAASAQWLASGNVDVSGGFTLFVVASLTAVPATRNGMVKIAPSFSDAGTSGFFVDELFDQSSQIIEMGTPDVTQWYWTSASHVIDTNAHVWEFNITGTSTTSKVLRDGTDLTPGGTGFPASYALPSAGTPVFLGAGYGSNAQDGSQAEVILFSPALSTANRDKVRSRLKALYGTG
jgi:hypothetical protein